MLETPMLKYIEPLLMIIILLFIMLFLKVTATCETRGLRINSDGKKRKVSICITGYRELSNNS